MRSETLRLAVAQCPVSGEVPTAEVLALAGEQIRVEMAAAAAAGARVVQFPEGALTSPSKRHMSAPGSEVGEAEWSRVDWAALRHELASVARAAGDLGVWAVVGAPHRLSGRQRPHNSLYVFSDRGELATRYDKRRLSVTEVTSMYTAGTDPTVFEVDGFRLGAVLCLELLFPELFVEYAAMDVDVVLASSAPSGAFSVLAQAHAVMNAVSVALAVAAGPDAVVSPSGICSPEGWVVRRPDGQAGLVTTNVARAPRAAGFQRRARNGLYDDHLPQGDHRSLDRRSL